MEINRENYIRIENREANPVLAKLISSKRNIPIKDVELVLSLNVISFKQLQLLTGRTDSHIRNDSMPRLLRTGEKSVGFNIVNPFPDNRKGKMFIMLDDKCVSYIKKCLKEK